MSALESDIEQMCRAHDAEAAAQKGEPSPWDIEPDAPDFAEWREERLAAMRVALDAWYGRRA